MIQDEGFVVTLKHRNQGGYLRGTTEQLARTTKKFYFFTSTYQEADRFYVVLDNQPDYWILRTKHNHSNQLRYGDEFTLRHKSSRRYLNSFSAEKSETTEQGLMCLSDTEQWFFMQTSNPQDIAINNKSNVRIFNSADRQTLHSHYNKYRFYKVQNYREVTSFKERDENDYWQIYLETPMCVEIDYKLIKSGDKVLIKNIHDLEYLQPVGNNIELVKSNQQGAKSMNMQLIFDNFDQTYIHIVPTKQFIDIDENDTIRLQNAKIRSFQIIPIKSKEFLLGQYFYIQIHDKFLSKELNKNEKLSLNQFPNSLSIWVIEEKE